MMPIARHMDQGVGYCSDHDGHESTGIVISTQFTVIANGMPVARMLDTVISGCGSTGIIIGGSSKVFCSGIPMARFGDQFVGTFTGIIVSGASSVFCA